ncbi:MAG: hypothetical protein EB127_00050 [Alphaproteobacteria bacterium]|nr:hypothetical protein [Alphaproteobacteria bacterium]
MALKLFKLLDDNSFQEVDNVNRRITSFHDTSDGSYAITKFYLVNDPIEVGYENITVTLFINNMENSPISQNGIVYQLLATRSETDVPTSKEWENIPYNNEIAISNIDVGVESYRYFALRTYVPRGHGANYISEASLKVSATEIVG